MRSFIQVLALSSLTALAACAGGAPGSPTGGGDPAEGQVKSSELLPYPIPILNLNPNLLLNPGFETPQTPLVPLYSGFVDRGNPPNAWFAGWGTAALDWPATSNELTYSTVTTWLTNEIWPGAAAGTHSILVADGTEDGGIAQQYLGNWTAGTTIPLHQLLTVHAKVLAGTLTIAIGNSTQTNVTTTWAYGSSVVNPNTNGPQWETITKCAPPGVNANEVFFYALGAPATYYLDEASVVTSSACP
jgi:hypothetical protein